MVILHHNITSPQHYYIIFSLLFSCFLLFSLVLSCFTSCLFIFSSNNINTQPPNTFNTVENITFFWKQGSTIMNYLVAINLLAPYHNAQLVCISPDTDSVTGQLSTGCPDNPLIPVNNGFVFEDDIYSVLEYYSSSHPSHPSHPYHLLHQLPFLMPLTLLSA